MDNYIKTYEAYRKKIIAYHYFAWLMSWDQETEAPEESVDYRTNQFQILAEEMYQIESAPEYIEAIDYLYAHLDELEDRDYQTEIKRVYKDLRMIKCVPKDELIAYQVLTSQASHVWAKAKNENNYELYEPTLEKIVEYKKNQVKYLATKELQGYDILLDIFEEGFTTKEYDQFFNTLKQELVPFVKEVTAQKAKFSRKLTHGIYPREQQIKFSQYLLDVFHYDRKRGLLKESAHPFTSGVSAYDTRITTHYDEQNLPSSIFSTIHEMGHGIYEQQNDPRYDKTFLHGGTSLGIHESQSRMYENMLGRSLSFWKTHYNKLVELFPKQLKNISVEEFHRYINRAQRSLIRIEADELTYALHIMVRYELEKGLISGKIKVKDLPKKWNKLMAEYLGVRPKTDKEGVLQDIHWSGGDFGYFPTYALGSAYAAQIYQAMNKEIQIDELLENNQIQTINAWLKERIHKFAASKSPKELMLIATQEPFNPYYYINYLKNKFQN